MARRRQEMKEKIDGLWASAIERGRLAQWLLIGGGVAICLFGMATEYLEAQQVIMVFLAMLSAAFGLKGKED